MQRGNVDGLPGSVAAPTRAMGPLMTHVEREEEGNNATSDQVPPVVPRRRKTPVVPSLQTLEKAVAAKIYFENLYFPLLRHPPSREQRRLALEREMELLRISESQKQDLRARWRQNESDYLRERRQKVDVSAFVKLKTIGHGLYFSPHSLISYLLCSNRRCRRFWSSFSRKREDDWTVLRYETGWLAMNRILPSLLACIVGIGKLMPPFRSYAKQICYVKGRKLMFARKGIF
jgi:hypothetical protein